MILENSPFETPLHPENITVALPFPRPQAYALDRRVENASLSGSPLRHRGFFVPASPIGLLAGGATREGARCTQAQFSTPASRPAPIAGFSFVLENRP